MYCTFMMLSRLVLLRMRTISATRCRETQNTHFMFCKLFPPENRAVYEMRENRLEQATDDNIIRLMRYACWITKATNTHPEYVILNCSTTATMVARTHLSVTLYVHCLSCFVFTLISATIRLFCLGT
jgi:hypothetical protein